jgi:hypothetical protein
MFQDTIQVRSNFVLTARERGKIAPDLCRKNHNVWVNFGREYLAKVVSPGGLDSSVITYICLGIGGNKQTVNIASLYPQLNTDYPGTNNVDKGTRTTLTLERPILFSGTTGVGGSGDWGSAIIVPVTLVSVGGVFSTVQFTAMFDDQTVNISGAYPAVPISEAGLMKNLTTGVTGAAYTDIYSYSSPPYYVGPNRPSLVAYNNFAPITKTTDISFEINWQLEF